MAYAIDPSAPAAHSNSPDNLIVDCCTDGEEGFSGRRRRRPPINYQWVRLLLADQNGSTPSTNKGSSRHHPLIQLTRTFRYEMSQVASAAIASTMTDLTASPARYKWTHFALAVFVFPRGDSAQQFTDEFLDKTIISIHDLQSTHTSNVDL
jgi:hypothetical protein